MTGPNSIQQFARVLNASVTDLHRNLGASVERMIAIQSEAYPSDWSDADKREVAMKHLGMGEEQ
jgi:hypothetical protein